MSDSPRACLRVGCIHQCPSAAQAGWGWPRTELAMAPSMPPQWELPAGLADLGEPVRQRGVRGHGLCWVPALDLSGVRTGCSWDCGVDQGLDDPGTPALQQGFGSCEELHDGPGAVGRAAERGSSTEGPRSGASPAPSRWAALRDPGPMGTAVAVGSGPSKEGVGAGRGLLQLWGVCCGRCGAGWARLGAPRTPGPGLGRRAGGRAGTPAPRAVGSAERGLGGCCFPRSCGI